MDARDACNVAGSGAGTLRPIRADAGALRLIGAGSWAGAGAVRPVEAGAFAPLEQMAPAKPHGDLPES